MILRIRPIDHVIWNIAGCVLEFHGSYKLVFEPNKKRLDHLSNTGVKRLNRTFGSGCGVNGRSKRVFVAAHVTKRRSAFFEQERNL